MKVRAVLFVDVMKDNYFEGEGESVNNYDKEFYVDFESVEGLKTALAKSLSEFTDIAVKEFMELAEWDFEEKTLFYSRNETTDGLKAILTEKEPNGLVANYQIVLKEFLKVVDLDLEQMIVEENVDLTVCPNVLNDTFLEMVDEEFSIHHQSDGVELETWTEGGVNMFISLSIEESPYIRQFAEYIKDFDVESEIEIHRGDSLYKSHFDLGESLSDFEGYLDRLKKIFYTIQQTK